MIISLDTETTGTDFVHGTKPFLITTCDDEGTIRFWEWDVDPLTRQPEIPNSDLTDIAELIDAAELIYLQNSKFDAHALDVIGLTLPWDKVRDTLVAGHLLATNHRHDLTSMCLEYLDVDIEPYEKKVEEVVKACRGIVKREYPNWRIAKEDMPDMPSVSGSSKRDEDHPWKCDMWLPRALAKVRYKGINFTSEWENATSKYANADSVHTLALGLVMEQRLREMDVWPIYMHRLQLMRVAFEMECRGVTAIGEYTERTIQDYTDYSHCAGETLKDIAADYGHDLQLAEGASLNDNMRDFFYGAVHQVCPKCQYTKRIKHWNGDRPEVGATCPKCSKTKRKQVGRAWPLVTHQQPNLSLKVIDGVKSGRASLDKEAMGEYLSTLDTNSQPHIFIKTLVDKRKHDTELSYMKSYKRFWVPVPNHPGYYRIHPSLNPCGTDHLRWASNSPNLQNVGKQEVRCEECDGSGCEECDGTGIKMMSARNCFGPAPDREWWSMDFQSIEERIPAYESGERVLIDLFEKPDEPPYWGSNHNLTASLLWPELYHPIAHIKGEFKKPGRYINEYKRAKNTNFAKNYGAGKRKVEVTAGVKNAFDLIDRGKPELAKLQTYYLKFAEQHGWVYTLPDRSVDPEVGYPILASRTDDGRVLSTTPFNYHVSGTACWCKNTALIRCANQCREWRSQGFDAYVSLEIHDELLFDFPRGTTYEENLPKALILKDLMEQSGRDLVPSIPLPVTVEYHSSTWASGVVC